MTGRFKTSGVQTYPPALCNALAQVFVDSFRDMVSEGKIRPQGQLASPLAEIEAALVHSKPPAPQLRKVRVPDLEASWFPPRRWRLTFRGPG